MSDSEEEDVLTAEEALVLLRKPDFIMDPKVEKVLNAYLCQSGTMETAIDLLSTNYAGTSQLCKLMSDWLLALGVDPKPIEENLLIDEESEEKEEKGKEEEKKGKPTGKKPASPKKGRGRGKKEDPKKASASVPSVPEKVVDAAEEVVTGAVEGSLSSLLLRHFRSPCADSIFEEGGAGIEWLPQLIAHKQWRRVIYQLIDTHPQCLMLNFAVKLISDAGFQSEISNVNTASQQLEIFSRVLIASIDSVLKEHRRGAHTDKYEMAFQELIRVACHSEHAYVYTSAMLETLSREETGMNAAACVHIMQSLRMAMKGKEQETTSLHCAMLQTAEDQVAPHLVQALLTMTSKGELNPADITHIYQQYILPHPPPVEAIRDPLFTEMLIDSLFHCDGPKVNMEHRDKYIFLLAYAASVSEVYRNGRRSQTRVELDVSRAAIERAASSVETTDEVLGELPELLREARVPVVASGLLHYAGTLLLSETRLGEPPSWAFVLVDHISSLHPNLHSIAFSLSCQLYDKVSSETEAAEVIMERQRSVVDRFVHLFSVGAALPILEKITAMYRDAHIDASLVRYFAIEVLDIISPPYSRDLCSLLFPLVSDTEIFDKTLFDRTPTAGEFIQYCQATFKDPLFQQAALVMPPVTSSST